MKRLLWPRNDKGVIQDKRYFGKSTHNNKLTNTRRKCNAILARNLSSLEQLKLPFQHLTMLVPNACMYVSVCMCVCVFV